MPRIDWFITELNIMGGAENFVFRVAPLLYRYGWQLRVITLQQGGHFLHTLSRMGIPCVELGFHLTSGASVISRLNRLWLDSPPDILHTHLYHAGILGRLLAIKTRIPVVLIHQHGLERNRSQLRSYIDQSLSHRVTRYLTSCEAVSTMLQVRERIPQSKITVIYNGVSLEGNRNIAAINNDAPPDYQGLKLPPFIIGTVGRLEPEKGHEILLDSYFKLIRSDTPASELHIIGDGSLKERLTRIAHELGIGKQVHFPGNQESLLPYWGKMDLFILPSRWEGLSMALLEAMSHGIPVIATNVGGTPEVITHLYNGILIPPDNPGAMTEAIELLRQNPIFRKELGKRGKSHVAANFTLEKTVSNLDSLYKRMLL